ncbi:MAG: hypothetical protein AAF567_14240 [Actinomycetota bacterium]
MNIEGIGLIGLGHVGKNVLERIEPIAPVVQYDTAWGTPYPTEELAACDLAIVCVPTPSLASGECDTSIVEKAVAALPCDRVWIRSTITPGTSDMLAERYGKRVCFSPEYVGETTFSDAYDLEEFMIVGGEPEDRRFIMDLVMRGPQRPSRFIQCTNTEAELVKYMENAFLAAKVGLVAEFHELSETLGLDWYTVREAWLADPRIGTAHSHALSHDLGFSGKCLPKDVAALCSFADRSGSPLKVLESVRDANVERRDDVIDLRAACEDSPQG